MINIKFAAFAAAVVFLEKVEFTREKFWATGALAGIGVLTV